MKSSIVKLCFVIISVSLLGSLDTRTSVLILCPWRYILRYYRSGCFLKASITHTCATKCKFHEICRLWLKSLNGFEAGIILYSQALSKLYHFLLHLILSRISSHVARHKSMSNFIPRRRIFSMWHSYWIQWTNSSIIRGSGNLSAWLDTEQWERPYGAT